MNWTVKPFTFGALIHQLTFICFIYGETICTTGTAVNIVNQHTLL